MLDMGFLRDIKKILALIPDRRQNLLFSATFSKQIKELAGTFMHDPEMVEATPENTAVEKIIQKVVRVDKGKKPALLIKMINEGDWRQVLVFARTKHGANRLSKKLDQHGITSSAIHGDKSQGARTSALAGFKKGTVRVLVATDIAARGLDIPLLPHVVNFELPHVSEDYVHRIGRTGRAGASGEAISLVAVDELSLIKGIEKLLGERIPSEVVAGYEPLDKPGASPVKKPPVRNKKKTDVSSKKSSFGKKKWSYSGKSDSSNSSESGNKPRRNKKRY